MASEQCTELLKAAHLPMERALAVAAAEYDWEVSPVIKEAECRAVVVLATQENSRTRGFWFWEIFRTGSRPETQRATSFS